MGMASYTSERHKERADQIMKSQLNKWRDGVAVLALMACTAMSWGQVLANENPAPKQLVQALQQVPALEEAFAAGQALWSNKQPRYAHPFYWAPFIFMGNWK
jgi:CHAT domain-containing protein